MNFEPVVDADDSYEATIMHMFCLNAVSQVPRAFGAENIWFSEAPDVSLAVSLASTEWCTSNWIGSYQ